MNDSSSLGVIGLSRAYHSGRLRPPEVIESVFERIASADPVIGAFTALDPERAMRDAEKLDAELRSGRSRGLLHGVPIAVKELFDVQNLPATYGSLTRADCVAAADAEVVRRIRRAGAVVVGLARSHEFGWGITTQHSRRGSTRNPRNLDYIPGGSSGGSAAAVAARLVPAALASDTGGSIRIPAALCGVAGIKPTFGRIPRTGGVPLAPSLDTPGFIARTADDLDPLLRAASGYFASDPETRLPGMLTPDLPSPSLVGRRVGISADMLDGPVGTSQLAAYQRTLDAMADLGAEIVQLHLPTAAEYRETFALIQMAEAYDVHHRRLKLFPQQQEDYGEDVRARLRAAESVDMAAFMYASERRRHLVASLDTALANVDVLLTPVNACTPPLRTDPDHVVNADGRRQPFRDSIMGYTVPQNLAGVPAATICAGADEAGLPCGVQLTASRGHEHAVLEFACALERQLDLEGLADIFPQPGTNSQAVTFGPER